MRVLLVEDHEIVRRGLCSLLSEQWPDIQIDEAADLPAALEQLTSGRSWDLVILDINLPSGSGLDLLAEPCVRQSSVPVLVLSLSAEDEFALRSFKLGASGYISKSSASEELITACRRLLAGGKHVSPLFAERLSEVMALPSLPHETLSARELQVLKRVADGFTIKEIAHSLRLSDKTVATYRARLSLKLSLSSNVELARYAVKHRLVD